MVLGLFGGISMHPLTLGRRTGDFDAFLRPREKEESRYHSMTYLNSFRNFINDNCLVANSMAFD